MLLLEIIFTIITTSTTNTSNTALKRRRSSLNLSSFRNVCCRHFESRRTSQPSQHASHQWLQARNHHDHRKMRPFSGHIQVSSTFAIAALCCSISDSLLGALIVMLGARQSIKLLLLIKGVLLGYTLSPHVFDDQMLRAPLAPTFTSLSSSGRLLCTENFSIYLSTVVLLLYSPFDSSQLHLRRLLCNVISSLRPI